MSSRVTSFEDKGLEAKEKMVRGSMWMTAGSVLSRLLGAVYIIPWYAWMGKNGDIANSLFNKGYNVYALFLMIATAGIPGAVAKQLSHYNSLNEYGVSQKLFRRTLMIMAGFGVLFFGVMYVASPILAEGNKELIPVMRSLSWAILIFPCMSVIRGYFQGNQNMMPSAVSQVIEQIARVFYMLLATFIIMKVRDGNYVDAVIQSTFAAFIGMLGAFGTLIYFYLKQKPEINRLVANSDNVVILSENRLVFDMIKQAIPFTIVGSGITLFKLVDQFTFERMMSSFTGYTDKQLAALFSIFSANPDKLVMIIISLATGLAVTSLPLVTAAYSQKDRAGLAKLISDNIQLLFFIMIPATLGMMVLAEPMYVLFYKPDALGVHILVEACLVGLVTGYFILTSTTLQGLYHNNETIMILGIGLLVKFLLQYPMIRLFETYGPLISTAIGFTVSGILLTHAIHKITQFNYILTIRRTLLITVFSVIMMLVTWATKGILSLFLNQDRKLPAFIIVAVSVFIGIVAYAYMVLKVRLADKLLGPKVVKVRRKLHIK
ncbi:polysaccharide biosynthesis protein [Vagococcus penaei]|uniref:Polysaccharide biosynthesis protein n=1 Tax=Vagococcus penaei TaxID=633807 RepID=A0A1Q2D6I0_9ENTE|nr:polysaccharide biosynthesis protein [Vagococcus penaei]AQP53950.1 polysaccharide biosynthesis protein [Vagococcus penaei]RSU02885.1 polysaccharide biosynthesis protein [Vagococcus penaei]